MFQVIEVTMLEILTIFGIGVFCGGVGVGWYLYDGVTLIIGKRKGGKHDQARK